MTARETDALYWLVFVEDFTFEYARFLYKFMDRWQQDEMAQKGSEHREQCLIGLQKLFDEMS